jgi:hypothetical protein
MLAHTPQTVEDKKSAANVRPGPRRHQVRDGIVNALRFQNIVELREKSRVILLANDSVEFPFCRPQQMSDAGGSVITEESRCLGTFLCRYCRQGRRKLGAQLVGEDLKLLEGGQQRGYSLCGLLHQLVVTF